jgi:uncharacterized Zn finger protein
MSDEQKPVVLTADDEIKCPRCGTSPFQHWNCGYMHKCHVCGTIWRQSP